MAEGPDKALVDNVERRLGSVLAGKYTLEKVLGVGGMGTVYEGVHSFTERRVAVKLLHGDFSRLTEVGKRFLQEAKATAALDHPCILDVLDAGQDTDGRLYLVFERLYGQNLMDAVKQAPLPVEDLVRIFAHVLDALAVAHAQGIVHRDIKPGNVFLCEGKPFPGRVKLIDFGIARRSNQRIDDGLTQAGALLGTPAFMSPELLLGEPASPAADLWATSVSMYVALANKKPFKGRTPNELVTEIMKAEVKPIGAWRTEVPSAVAEVVHRGLEVERRRRWPSAEAMADALRAAAPYVEAPAARPTPRAELRELAPVRDEDWVPTEAVEIKPDWRVALDEIKEEIGALGASTSPLPKPEKEPSLWRRAASWLSRKKPDAE